MNIFSHLRRMINKNLHMLSTEEQDWWQGFMDDRGKIIQDLASPNPWILSTLRKTSPPPPATAPPAEDASPLTELMRKERSIPKVSYRFVVEK